MKDRKLIVLIINISEYNKNKLKIIKKNCTIYSLENPTSKKLILFLKNKKFPKIDILITNIGIYYDKFILKLFPNLKVILTPTTGVNHIDLNYIRKINKIVFIKKIKTEIFTSAEHKGINIAISKI